MIYDLYIRNPEDPNYQYGVLHHNNAIESIISKIKMILGTRSGQVFGNLSFGVGLEDLIFETKINKNQLEENLKTQFEKYISETKDYRITPEISFGKADGYDYAVLDVYINNEKIIGFLIK